MIAVLLAAAAMTVPHIADGPVATSAPAAATVDFLVSPKGKVLRCSVVPRSGDRQAAETFCAAPRSRSVTPSPSSGAAPAYAVVRVPVGGAARPDAVLSVRRLPGGLPTATATVLVAVDTTGTATACAPADGTRPDLAAAACSAPQFLDLRQTFDDAGLPVAYVTRRSAEFRVVAD